MVINSRVSVSHQRIHGDARGFICGQALLRKKIGQTPGKNQKPEYVLYMCRKLAEVPWKLARARGSPVANIRGSRVSK